MKGGRAALGVVIALQFPVAVYGGYFGAGIGILMLSVFGLLGLADIHEINALRTSSARSSISSPPRGSWRAGWWIGQWRA